MTLYTWLASSGDGARFNHICQLCKLRHRHLILLLLSPRPPSYPRIPVYRGANSLTRLMHARMILYGRAECTPCPVDGCCTPPPALSAAVGTSTSC